MSIVTETKSKSKYNRTGQKGEQKSILYKSAWCRMDFRRETQNIARQPQHPKKGNQKVEVM